MTETQRKKPAGTAPAPKGAAEKKGTARKTAAGASAAAVATAERATSQRVAFNKAANNTRRATGSGAASFWYKEHSGDLKDVTFGHENLDLGINQIDVFEPTQAQARQGILCKVRLQLLCGTIDNISVFESTYTPGDIYMQMGGGRPSKELDGKGKPVQWYHDTKLNDQTRAQILSYVSTLLEPVAE